jgi:hypothetical protein
VVLGLLGDEVLDVPTGELEEIAITDVIAKQTSCLQVAGDRLRTAVACP